MVFNRLLDFVKLLTQNKKSKKKRNVSFQNIPFGQFFLLLLFIVVISILIYIQIILDSDKIYANIFIDGYHVGGLERSEALKLIKENMDTSYLEDYLALYTAESEYELYFRDIDYLPDYDNAINLAYKIGRNGSNIQRLCEIWNVYRTGLQITPTMCYNVEKVASLLHNICNEINKKAINAEIKVNKGIITISPHVVGRILDVNSTLNRIKTALVNKQWNDVELCVLEITPDVTTEMVENITYKLAEFSTAFNPNNEARTHNIRNACKKIDQSLLLPQQEFSMDKALGDRTVQNGYKQAKVIVNNEYVDGLGGGICQVTSTVYNTVLLSGLEVLERRNHTLPASYIGVGRDATISQGYIDLKFKNTSEYSVLIEAKTVENKIVVVLWGLEPKEQTRFKIRTKIVQTIEPEGIEIVIDPSLKEGEAEVLREAKPGYKVEVYRDRLDKFGNIIETEKISVDSYLPQKMKIRAGE